MLFLCYNISYCIFSNGIKMRFYFKNGFRKLFVHIVVVLASILFGNCLYAQTSTTVPIVTEVSTNDNTNKLVSVQLINASIANNLVDVPKTDIVIADKEIIKPKKRTMLALAALADNSLATANKIASEELKKCVDFSTIDATIQFHIVMLFAVEKSYGAEKSLILLDSQTSFGLLFGIEMPMHPPQELVESIAFWKACCLSDLNKREEAIDILRKLLDTNNFKYDFLRVEVLRRLCYELIISGQYDEAISLYSTKDLPPVTDELCGESVALFRMGYAHTLFMVNRAGDAEEEIRKLINDLSNQPILKATALLFNVELLLAGNKASEAIELFKENNKSDLLEKASPRVKALLLCKYAQALAYATEKQPAAIDSAIAAAIEILLLPYLLL
jgi:tetratricopeptide (TPR) repeat protein